MMVWLINHKQSMMIICLLAIVSGTGWFLFTKGPLGPTKVTVTKAHKESLNPSVLVLVLSKRVCLTLLVLRRPDAY